MTVVLVGQDKTAASEDFGDSVHVTFYILLYCGQYALNTELLQCWQSILFVHLDMSSVQPRCSIVVIVAVR